MVVRSFVVDLMDGTRLVCCFPCLWYDVLIGVYDTMDFSLVQGRGDELRIQKRFLNDMFARVKQEYLEGRLRQQQIELLLGCKNNLAALPSTAAEEPGSSNALALLPSSGDNALAEQSEASPGRILYILADARLPL